jgi:lysophospholipase L1-like esterase
MRSNSFLVALGAFGAAPPAARAAGDPVRIAVLGDSLALATGASRADGGFLFPAFRRLLATHPGATLDNVAIGGSTVADVVRLQVPRIAAIAPDVIIVCVGGNDVVRRTPRAAFARDYLRLLAELRRTAPHARTICCGVPDVAVSPIFADERRAVASLSAADDRAARAAARANGASFVDFFALTQRVRANDERFFSRDRFHPSDAGYALLSSELWPALSAAATR